MRDAARQKDKAAGLGMESFVANRHVHLAFKNVKRLIFILMKMGQRFTARRDKVFDEGEAIVRQCACRLERQPLAHTQDGLPLIVGKGIAACRRYSHVMCS
jgi:hypothetical protein